VFERRNRRMDGMDFDGWHLTTWNDQAHLTPRTRSRARRRRSSRRPRRNR
jgi:hypothetical protein